MKKNEKACSAGIGGGLSGVAGASGKEPGDASRFLLILAREKTSRLGPTHPAFPRFYAVRDLFLPNDQELETKSLWHASRCTFGLIFAVGRDTAKSSSGFTTGMAALGHMEFEAQGAPEPPGELRKRFEALAGYVLEHGPVIEDGDTIGEDANERIRVVFSDSAFGHEGKVMRLEYERPSPQKPWWLW
jgi:hypothetical protein